ncbi:hypothetical protein [Chengkuizengella sediminis]|uniref:hypothetical protein n=1 Tax=Chengkuizengella sediminis TaxID=1885917 RepID=UPI0013898AFA|nr:hypothetical protein [Chengkuizengella sediminis]NDI35051.1 hypothetical protein [Chengkuizengella sediminis]
MTVVGILGMTHSLELQEKYNGTLSLIKELILEFNPDVICGEVHPLSWELFLKEGDPHGILKETQDEYPNLIFPLCKEKGIQFVPVNWFEEDVFVEGPFDKFDPETREQLEAELDRWTEKQFETVHKGNIPFNSPGYDKVTEKLYEWLHGVNPELQNIRWNARHYIMVARVKNAAKKYAGKRILCIHGADHNYWYYKSLKNEEGIEVVYPLK